MFNLETAARVSNLISVANIINLLICTKKEYNIKHLLTKNPRN